MKEDVKNAIEEYQCPGCVTGGSIECFEKATSGGAQCGKHSAGTMGTGIGRFFLGLPTGFNRLGLVEKMYVNIFETFDDGWGYDMFNVPAWKYKNKHGHILVRGISPRINQPFIHIFLEDCLDKIDCFEITEKDIEEMD